MASDGVPANAAVRGGALIAITVLLGVVLLSQGFANEGGLVDTGDTNGATTTEPTNGDDPATTDPTDPTGENGTPGDEPDQNLPEPRDQAQVTAWVLNGSGTTGAAGRVRDYLSSLNYTTRAPENVPGGERIAETVIYHVEDFRSEALRLAQELEVPTELVQLMPEPAPFGVELDATQVIVVLGEDQAIARAG
ncbi:MAG: LytR C-terminal domain-containing protein [Acidimicrobiales bacterium]